MGKHAEKRRRRRGPLAIAIALVVGMLVSALTAWDASQSAFSATTQNGGNSWSTGSVQLTDNDGGSTAMFSASGLTPSSAQVDECIEVTYNGSASASAVKIYGLSTMTTGLAPYVNLTITKGTAGSTTFDNCTGFTADTTNPYSYSGTLATFDGACYDSWAHGCDVHWAAAPGESRWFKFSTTIASDNNAQGLTLSSVPFTWEAQG
jgi:hypothetical protein